MSTITRTRPPVKRNLRPATGTCSWLLQPGAYGAPGFLSINRTVYILTENLDALRLIGYRLEKQSGDGAVYDIGLDSKGKPACCDCPDAIYNDARQGGCKHRKALTVLLARLESPPQAK